MSSISRNVFYNSMLSISQVAYPLITFPYISRILEPDGIGKYAFIDSFTQYFILVAALGIPIYGVREVARLKNDVSQRSTLFWELVVLHTSLSILSSIIYLLCLTLIPQLREVSNLGYIGLVILLINPFTFEWFFQGLGDFKFLAIRTTVIKFLTIASVFLFVREKADLNVYYILILVGNVVLVFANFIKIRKKINGIGSINIKKHLKPLLFILACNVSISLYTILDNIILGFLANKIYVGYYSAAIRVSKICLVFISAFSMVMIPKFSETFKENNTSKISELINVSFEYIFFTTVPIAVILFICAPEIIWVFAGKEYLSSISAIQLLSPISILIGLSNLFGMQILISKGKERSLLKGVVAGLFVSIFLNIFLDKHYMHIGAAIASLIAEIAVTGALFYFAIKEVKFSFPFASIRNAVLSSLPFFLIYRGILLFNLSPLIYLIIFFCLAGATYLAIQMFIFNSPISVFINRKVKAILYA